MYLRSFLLVQSMTSKCHTFFKKKTSKTCDNLRTFTQNVPFLDYNKTKQKTKRCDNLECGNLRSSTVVDFLYILFTRTVFNSGSICAGLLENPVRLRECEHAFCQKCLEEWIRVNYADFYVPCPECRSNFNKSSDVIVWVSIF